MKRLNGRVIHRQVTRPFSLAGPPMPGPAGRTF